jgi:UDP-N-acetylglucosamine 2-epimerase (non-hydrolysing)
MRIVHVVGARPNFMKIAPLVSALSVRRGVEQILVHTGQHYDEQMSAGFFRDLGIPEPDLNLEVGSGSHAVQTAEVMKAFEPVVERFEPDLVVVVGDVNSTMACTLVAAKLGAPVAHVEAGLRSRDRAMPEEINRIVTDQLATLLLTPSLDGNENLRAEGIPDSRVHFVGNIMIDTLLQHVDTARRGDPCGRFGVARRGFAFVTLHRPSNVDDRDQLGQIYEALAAVAREMPVLFPMHPRTRKTTDAFGLWPRLGDVRVLDPLGYLDALGLMDAATIVLTDSGGIQEETTALGVPCVTLRDTTERPVTITEGTNVLVPVRTRAKILAAVPEARAKTGQIPEKWDGRTADRIADVFQQWFAARPSPNGRGRAGVVPTTQPVS